MAKQKLKKNIKLIVAGSRSIEEKEIIYESIDRMVKEHYFDAKSLEIVSGGAIGPDRIGEQYAADRGLNVHSFPANWKKNGKAAGPIRNAKMAKFADALILFWDCESRGSKNMLENAGKEKLKYVKIHSTCEDWRSKFKNIMQ